MPLATSSSRSIRGRLWIAALSVTFVALASWAPIWAADEPPFSPAARSHNAALQVAPAAAPVSLALPSNPRLERIFAGGVPRNTADLKQMQERFRRVAEKAIPVTVGVRMPNGMGSGVIVTEDGYVLTAGHVVGRPDQEVEIVLPGGRHLKAKTLGANYGIDSGLIKITEPGKWPHAEMGDSSRLSPGQWCIAAGHPGGFEEGRTPPLRFGRILEVSPQAIVTDCPLVGGDSGGPLFDTDGRVIGINSRIGNELYSNIHVPVSTYRETWDRLAKGEAWGGRRPGGPVIGVIADPTADSATVGDVVDYSPADEAGVRPGDVITEFAGSPTPTFDSLISEVAKTEPGDRVKIELRRGEQTLTLELVIGRNGG